MSSYAIALSNVPASNPMTSPVARYARAIGPANASPMNSAAEENPPHKKAAHRLTPATYGTTAAISGMASRLYGRQRAVNTWRGVGGTLA
jgi:hypothetical protein